MWHDLFNFDREFAGEIASSLASACLTLYVRHRLDRHLKMSGELQAVAIRWAVRREKPDIGGAWLSLTTAFVNGQDVAVTLSRFRLHVCFIDPMDDFIAVQRHRLLSEPIWNSHEVIVTVSPKSKQEHTLWAYVDEDELSEIDEQKRTISIKVSCHDPCDKRYWRRLLLTASGLEHHFAEDLGAGEWCDEACDEQSLTGKELLAMKEANAAAGDVEHSYRVQFFPPWNGFEGVLILDGGPQP